jgi:hypothetical protein
LSYLRTRKSCHKPPKMTRTESGSQGASVGKLWSARRMPKLRSPRLKDIAPGWKRALPRGLLHLDSDQSVVRASQLAQHDRTLAAGVRCRLALADVAPPDVAPLPPTRDAGACHPHVRAIGPRVCRRQDIRLRAGADPHVAAHRHAHAALCHLQLGFVRTVRVCGSEVGWMRGCVSLKG